MLLGDNDSGGSLYSGSLAAFGSAKNSYANGVVDYPGTSAILEVTPAAPNLLLHAGDLCPSAAVARASSELANQAGAGTDCRPAGAAVLDRAQGGAPDGLP